MIKKIAFLGLVTVFLFVPRVEASEFLPLSHWSYAAVDKLGAYGLIDLQKLGTKPYRREDVSKWTQEAIRRIQNREVRIGNGENDLEVILLKLKKEFLDQPPGKARFESSAKITYAALDTPSFSPGNANGRDNYDGLNLRLSGRAAFQINKHLNLVLSPVVYYQNTGTDEAEVTLEEAYLSGRLGNWELTAGRLPQWWGAGQEGQLLLTNNTFPFDLFRISNNEPFYWPWILRNLGPSYYTFYATRLEADRPIAHPFITGHRFEVNPTSYLSLGFSRTILLGGDGRNYQFEPWNYFLIFLGRPQYEYRSEETIPRLDTDQQLSWDFRWRIDNVERFLPFLGDTMQVYGELGREVTSRSMLDFVNHPEAYLAGIFIPSVLHQEGLDLRVEYADTYIHYWPNYWYTHGTYSPGLYYRGKVIGHQMQTGRDLFINITQRFSEQWTADWSFDRQEHFPVTDPAEIQTSIGINLKYLPLEPKKPEWNFGANYATIDNLNNSSGQKADDFLFSVSTNIRF
ncbi:MAG: capsule assembly Wzi family protein [Candidatus Ratteibacteria bacterium]|jgi:hypothetical protein